MGLGTKTYWLTDRQSQCDFDFDFDLSSPVVLGGRQPWNVRSWRWSDRVIISDRFPLSEGVQSSRLRVWVISEVKWSEVKGSEVKWSEGKWSEEEESLSPCEDFTCEYKTWFVRNI
jgi:hypothetical protein